MFNNFYRESFSYSFFPYSLILPFFLQIIECVCVSTVNHIWWFVCFSLSLAPSHSMEKRKNSAVAAVAPLRNPSKRILYIYWMDLGCILIALMMVRIYYVCHVWNSYTTRRTVRVSERARMGDILLNKISKNERQTSQHTTGSQQQRRWRQRWQRKELGTKSQPLSHPSSQHHLPSCRSRVYISEKIIIIMFKIGVGVSASVCSMCALIYYVAIILHIVHSANTLFRSLWEKLSCYTTHVVCTKTEFVVNFFLSSLLFFVFWFDVCVTS